MAARRKVLKTSYWLSHDMHGVDTSGNSRVHACVAATVIAFFQCPTLCTRCCDSGRMPPMSYSVNSLLRQ